jgi:Domain of Unknown Function (DUF928)
MNKSKFFLTSSLILGMFIVNFSPELPKSASAQKSTPNLQQASRLAQNSRRRRNGGSRLVGRLREEIPVRVRSASVCAIAPPTQFMNTTNIIWSDRPRFIWQGTIRRVELFVSDTDKLVWSKTVSESDRSVVYDGKPLQPGQRYTWRFYQSLRGSDFEAKSFRIMSSPERDKIAADLTQLENQLKAENATAEEIALERANYFAAKERRLWSDALQEVYSVQNPSEEVNAVIQEITTSICG